MGVYRNILVAIDCSPADHAIIEHVSALALHHGARVRLLHVVHSHTLDQERVLRNEAAAILVGYLDSMLASGIEAGMVIRSGEPEKEIVREIEENDYDLLAMAAHGHRLAERILLGSVSRVLREKISIPMLLVRADR